MVKISEKYSKTSSFEFVPGATYIGDSRVLGLGVFLDHDDSSKILLRFKNKKTRQVDYKEFSRAVDFIENFRSGEAYLYESPDPKPLRISIVLSESSRVLLRIEDSSAALLPLDFFQTSNVLVAIKKKMEAMVHKRLEREAFLNKGSLLEQIRKWSGLITFTLLSFIDFYIIISLFFWPQRYVYGLSLTLFLAFWLFILKPAWAPAILEALKKYINEDLIKDLAELHFPQKSIEIFLIIIILTAFYFFFGSEAANFILKYYKHSTIP